MELRQQVTLTVAESKEILLQHLTRKGLRIKKTNIRFERDGSLFATTMTEDEIYLEDTIILFKKPLSLFELNNPNLKKKLIAKMTEHAGIGNLLEFGGDFLTSTNAHMVDKFKKENKLCSRLFENSHGKKDKLKTEEEDLLIKTFAELGIKVIKTL